MYRIGLSGGVGCGKSTVSSYLKELGIPIIDGDKLAREAVRPGSAAMEDIRRAFGEAIFNKDGTLDRLKTAEIVFTKEEKRQQLNAIIHPFIWHRTQEELLKAQEEGHDLVVLDMPLLLEISWQLRVEEVWIVKVPLEMQIERVTLRDGLMRKYYQRRLPENPMKDYYYIQRLTGDAETLLVEYGFIDNQADARKLQNNIEDYVEGALKAIVEYAGYEYKEPSSGDDNSDYYTVKRGDSLWSIANKYNTTVAELVETNNLGSNTLQIGQVLRIPRKSTTPNENTTIYVVKRGDSLWKIANDYGVTVDVLKELNNLTTNGLQIGQQLIVPAQASDTPANEIVYTVKKGDSLWTIAQQYNTTISALKTRNNLTSNVLSIGQQLIIPSSTQTPSNDSNNTPPAEKTYVVQRGDSLWLIASKNNTTVDELKRLNNLTSNVLQIGQILRIQ